MFLYNTLSRKKEQFVPLGDEVKMYVCGPTVYNLFHVGNARCFIVFDTLRRFLEYRGYKVKYVQNFTDIDDKMIRKANAEDTTVAAIAEKYITEYKKDAQGLGITPATCHPRATENIDAIIELISTLIEKGFAYEAQGDVYFSPSAFGGYGKLSGMPIDELEAGARVDTGETKREPMDFALWKAQKPGEPAWQSPWGMGRPGWHIECSAMSGKLLGESIDIHCGGQDLVFPHHENERAQSEAATGKPFVKYWLHNGFINVDSKKMSKSENNFFTVRDAAERFGYQSIRFFLLSSHYRTPVNFTEQTLTSAKASLERIHVCGESLSFMLEKAEERALSEDEKEILNALEGRKTCFIEALDDDFNTANATSQLFEMVSDINSALVNLPSPSRAFLSQAKGLYDELAGLLGFLKPEGDSLDKEVEELIEKRTQAKKSKNFAEADRIRDELKSKGIILEDTAQGVKWRRV
ncbi:MAG: cysteine--tRNA ligase [Eubacteriales bacterium]